MTLKKLKWLPLILSFIFPLSAQATALTLYTTSWSAYGKNPYEYDGAYKNNQPNGTLTYVKNPAMVQQFNKADVVAWSFLQVWNDKDPNQSRLHIPKSWNGLMHFDDLWGALPFEDSSAATLPPETNDFLHFCKAHNGACSTGQINNTTGRPELIHYTDQRGVGQLNSFGAFIHSNHYTAKRVIAIGGANSVDNHGISTATFDAIFANKHKFLNQFKSWMDHFKYLKGVDYDFEPPIDVHTGDQQSPSAKTLVDYKNLFELVKASRQILGNDAYISVTITVDKDYLEQINQSVEGGWFKQIAPFASAVNLMTYDLHGAWSKSSDPLTAVHAYIKHPETAHKDEFEVDRGAVGITKQVLAYGIPREKLQVGIAAYGRGFSGVAPGANRQLPGFEQPWSGSSSFKSRYTQQEELLPYNSVDKVIKELGYQSYEVKAKHEDGSTFVTGAYLYSPKAQQFVGYQSPQAVKALCEFVKANQLQGSIMWSADSDLPISHPKSLVHTYRTFCKQPAIENAKLV